MFAVIASLVALETTATMASADHLGCDPQIDPACDPATTEYYPETTEYSPDTTVYDGDTTVTDPALDQPFYDPATGLWYDPLTNEYFDPDTGLTVEPSALVTPTTVPPVDGPVGPPPGPSRAAVADGITTDVDVDLADTDDLTPAELSQIGAGRLLLAIDAAAELGAFERAPDPFVASLIAEIQSGVPSGGLTSDGYRSELARFAIDLPNLVRALTDAGSEVSPDLRLVVDDLSSTALEEIEAGQTSLFEADIWLNALTDLLEREGAEPQTAEDAAGDDAAVRELVAQFALATPEPTAEAQTATTVGAAPDSVASSTTAAPEATTVTTPAAADDTGAGTDTMPFAVAGGVAVAAGVVLFVFGRRRRGRRSAEPNSPTSVSPPASAPSASASTPALTDLLDASRRMTASLDPVEIGSIALAECQHLLGTEGGAVLERGGSSLVPVVESTPGLFALDQLERSSLLRVVETGRSVSMVATDDPALIELPMAMAAVPVVADGLISGVLAVVRVPSKPFGRDDLDALEMLAPLLGSALTAAKTHGSATAAMDTDALTGLMNRRRLDADLAALGPASRAAYVMVDIDHFKNFNDVNGHAGGDEALRQVAAVLADSVRPEDTVYRYGGEEFCVLLDDATVADAQAVAERARSAVAASSIPGGENQPGGRVTISVGVADTTGGPIDDLVERADGALYRAKHEGRNQVCVASSAL